jgi:hypothetical protein
MSDPQLIAFFLTLGEKSYPTAFWAEDNLRASKSERKPVAILIACIWLSVSRARYVRPVELREMALRVDVLARHLLVPQPIQHEADPTFSCVLFSHEKSTWNCNSTHVCPIAEQSKSPAMCVSCFPKFTDS